MKRGLTQIKRLQFFILDLFPFAKICVHLRFNKDLNSVPSATSVVKCHTVTKIMTLSSQQRKYLQTASLPLPGIVLGLSQKGTFLSPVSSIVLHVHVKQHEMHMSCCPTCTCRTALHVHLKQRYTPRLYTLLYERGLCQYRRKRLMTMTNTIKFTAESIYDQTIYDVRLKLLF